MTFFLYFTKFYYEYLMIKLYYLWKTPVQITKNERIISLINKTKIALQQKIEKQSNIVSSNPKFIKEYKQEPFSGIFDELAKQCKGNIYDIINISGNECIGSASVSTIVDFNYNGQCYNSDDEPNSYICFDFKSNSVSLSAYSIKSSNHKSPDYHQSWIIEGSNDQNDWVLLDSHTNDPSLNSKLKVGVFHINDEKMRNQKFKYIQLRMTGKSIQGNDYLDVLNIEFFGKYF